VRSDRSGPVRTEWEGRGGPGSQTGDTALMASATTPTSGPTREQLVPQLGEAIERATKRSEPSLADIARRVGVSERALRRYRRGQQCPARNTVQRIQVVCGIEGNELLAIWDRIELCPRHRHREDASVAAAKPSRRWPPRVLIMVVGIGVAVAAAAIAIGVSVGGSGSQTGSANWHRFPSNYKGPVWVRLAARSDGARRVTLRWGGLRSVVNVRVGARPVYLVTQKTGSDSVPLRVGIVPTAEIEFGHGSGLPKDGAVRPIDDQWTATANP